MYNKEELEIRERILKEMIKTLNDSKEEIDYKIMRLDNERKAIRLILDNVFIEEKEVYYGKSIRCENND